MPFFEFNGSQFYYELHGESETTVVFLNGVMMSTDSWNIQSPVFSRKYRVLLSDFLGQGQSSKPDEEYTFERHCHELKALLDHLDIKKAHFVGTSYGAEVGMMFSLLYPEYVKSLSLTGAVSESDFLLRSKIESWCIAARHAIKYGEKSDFLLISAPFNYSSNYLEQNQGYLQDRADYLADFSDEWFTSFIRLCECFKTLNITDRLSELTMPVLVVAAEHDVLKSVRFSAIIKRHIPHAETLIIMDAGHALVIEKADEFNTTVMGFIDKHSH